MILPEFLPLTPAGAAPHNIGSKTQINTNWRCSAPEYIAVRCTSNTD